MRMVVVSVFFSFVDSLVLPFLSLNNIYKNILDVGRIYARVGEKFIYDDHHLRTCRTHQETWLLMLPAAHDLYGFLAHMPFFFN